MSTYWLKFCVEVYFTKLSCILENLVRGIDTEEAGFLSFVDNMKAAEMKKREDEEKAIFEQINQVVRSDLLKNSC